MGKDTLIAWTHHTFNCWWGCQKVDEACDNCYAATFDRRVHGIGKEHWGHDAPRRFFGDKHWNEPVKWNEAARKAGERRRVFCSSMADVFEKRTDETGALMDAARVRLWTLIKATPWLDWQLLTKRANLVAEMLPADWGMGYDNAWLGCTVGNVKGLWRAEALRKVPARVRFISYEPALELVNFAPVLLDFDWLICGAESGSGARKMPEEWARDVRNQCQTAGTYFFLKQYADDKGRKISLPMLDGKQWMEFPGGAS